MLFPDFRKEVIELKRSILLKGLITALILCTVFSAFSFPLSALTNDTQIIDVEWERPSRIVDVEQRSDMFIISTSTEKQRINNFYITFPSDGGVRIYADTKGFFDNAENSQITYMTDGEAIVMAANDTQVRLYRNASPWRIDIINSSNIKVVSYSAQDMEFGYDDTNTLRKVRISTAIKENEMLFGLGERFNGFIQNGKTVEMWNYDSVGQLRTAYGDHNVGYKNIPILHSNIGYSVFFNSTYYAIADIGESDESLYSFEFYGPIFDFFVWTGTTEQNIASYHRLTGSTIIPPKWAFSYWAGQTGDVWRDGSRSEEITYQYISSVLEKYDELGTPIKNIYAEGCWYFDSVMDLFQKNGIHCFAWTDSTWRTYDGLGSMTSPEQFAGFDTLNENEYPLIRRNTNRLAYFTSLNAKWVDYTNPLSVDWLKARFLQPFRNGMQGMMVDFADTIDVNSYFYNGKTGDEMHNLYAYYYNKAMYEAFSSYWRDDYITFARAGCAGSQKFTAVFAGDQSSSFLGLSQVVSALLSASSSGIHIWGSDIGGYGTSNDKNKNDPEVYARWLQFGTFSPLMRAHGSSPRDPWAYDDNGAAVARFQKYYWVRESIIDYIYGAAIKAALENIGMTQPMAVAFPEQGRLAQNGTQYMFCGDLLVCPVTEEGASSLETDFPDGRWVSLWNGHAIEGGKTLTVDADLDTIPVYIAEGAAIPLTLGKTLKLGDAAEENDKIDTLLITPSSSKTVKKYYTAKDNTKTFVSDKLSDNRYCIQSEALCDKNIVLIYGVTANEVKVGDTVLSELSEYPDSSARKAGYYKDYQNNRTIVVTGGEWNYIEYSDSLERLTNLALNCRVFTNDDGDTLKTLTSAVDGKYDTATLIEKNEELEFYIDLGGLSNINSIQVKWGGEYASKYQISACSELNDSTEWTVIGSVENGRGGTDVIDLEKGEYRYIKFGGFERAQVKSPKLTEIEIYGDSLYIEPEGQPNINKMVDAVQTGVSTRIIIYSVCAVILIAAAAVATIVCVKRKRTAGKQGGRGE